MKNIIVYSTAACPYCTMAKKYFDDNNLKYKEIDVSADPKSAQEIQEKSGQMGVPMIIIKDKDKEEIIIGFDKDKIDNILKL